jgi:hypothetical protein
MDMTKDIHTPMSTSTPLLLTDGSAPADSTEYRRVIGALQYLGLTRPDIAFAVNRLSQFMHKPTACHWTAAKRIIRYLKQTMFPGILIQQSSPFNLQTFVDAEWAANTDTRVSTTAFITFLGSNPISWFARKQRAVSRYSTEAEFRALAAATSETVWLHSLITELGLHLQNPPQVFCDNIGATHFSLNPVQHSHETYRNRPSFCS